MRAFNIRPGKIIPHLDEEGLRLDLPAQAMTQVMELISGRREEAFRDLR